MTEMARQRELIEALAAAVREQTAREMNTADHPRPLEFDHNGFPVAQRSASFVTRVARLLVP